MWAAFYSFLTRSSTLSTTLLIVQMTTASRQSCCIAGQTVSCFLPFYIVCLTRESTAVSLGSQITYKIGHLLTSALAGHMTPVVKFNFLHIKMNDRKLENWIRFSKGFCLFFRAMD